MRRVLITGGAGFLGSHLCSQLVENGDHVICLDNFFTGHPENVAQLSTGPQSHRFELVRHDVVDRYYAEVDEIYHLACPASPPHYQRNPVRTLKTAVVGTMNILELAQATGARVLIASTSEVYGEPEIHPQCEDYWGYVNSIGKRACYDEGKRCGEALATAYAEQHGVEIRLARIFNTYGPRMHEQDGRVISNFVTQVLCGQPLTIYGDGSQTRSLCFCSDLIEGLMRLMAHPRDPGPVNLGNPEELSVRQIADLVRELAGSSSPIDYRPLPADDPTRRRPDISKARCVLGWEPRVSAAEGIARTIDYFRSRVPARSGNGRSSRIHSAVAAQPD
jgi:UDP-glucuronate decarboxylase